MPMMPYYYNNTTTLHDNVIVIVCSTNTKLTYSARTMTVLVQTPTFGGRDAERASAHQEPIVNKLGDSRQGVSGALEHRPLLHGVPVLPARGADTYLAFSFFPESLQKP